MNRTFGPMLTISVVAFGLTVIAAEKPTKEFQDMMKENASITGMTGLPAHITAKDYDAIAKDGATLKANFVKTEQFFAARKADDAVKIAQAGAKAAGDLESAAKAKDDAAIAAARMAITPNCGGCHMIHRETIYEIK